jgi:predicted O-linked N-acetylglucosamine transferase (SPINDLY family)
LNNDAPAACNQNSQAKLEITIGAENETGADPNTREVARLLNEAIHMHRSGRLAEAVQLCERVRQQAPNNLTSLLLSGTIELQFGRHDAAERFFRLAQAVAPHSADAAMGRVATLRAMGKYDDALVIVEDVLQRAPNHPVAWNNRANLLLETGRIAKAIESYDRAISIRSDYLDAWHNRGIARMASGSDAEAEVDFTHALELNPDYVPALVNRGRLRARQGAGRAKDAIADLQRAVSLDRTNPDAWHILGQSYLALGQHAEALSSWTAGLAQHATHGAMLHDRAFLFNALARYSDAVTDFERLITLNPGDTTAWQGHGIALARLNHEKEALESFSQALKFRPDDAVSLYNRAALLSALKRYAEAASDLEALIAVEPEFPRARGLLLSARLHLCDWKELEQQREEIDASLRRSSNAIHPFTYLWISDRPAMQLTCARLHTARAHPAARVPLYCGERYTHEKIRVAYLSGDFYQHAVPSLIAGVLENHDRTRFEILGISYGGNDGSPMRKRLEKACTRFFDVHEQDDASIAALLRNLETDIVIDLKGFTGPERPGILAHRPSPVQVNYLGYPGTMGAEYVDYLIADRTVIPPEERQFYAEQIIYLPDAYQANDSMRAISPDRITRRDVGLPEAAFVFCCFNGSQKILPSAFNSWMRILSQSENSVLWLLEDNQSAAANLRREAEVGGIDAERLIFARHEQPDRHLARLRLAELILDTLPYGAHTTASDALWAGVPVLTRMGSSFAGRVAASLLAAAGLPELITQSIAEYEAMAQKFAAAPELLSKIREKLARNRESCALFDTVRMTRNLEAAYAEMLQRHQRGESPASFEVP